MAASPALACAAALDAAKKRTLPPLEAAIPSLGLVLGVLGGELRDLQLTFADDGSAVQLPPLVVDLQ